MTSIQVQSTAMRTSAPVVREGRALRRGLLYCGVLSSLLYVATDVLGGLRYDGYSFTSQAISELMAVGAPSEGFVDPLFISYSALTLSFSVGIFRDAGRNRALRLTALMLMIYALIGFTGPTLFEMYPRGTGSAGADTPHIVLTAILVLLTLLAMGFGAFALGRRFRVYTFATLATVIVLGALSAPYGVRLAEEQPTPGFGIVERVNVYASLLWVGVLAVALMQRHAPARTRRWSVGYDEADAFTQGAGVSTASRDPARMSPSTRAVGFWSAVLAAVFSITYDIGQLAEWAGMLGSLGGPESGSTPLGLVVLLTPSLFLGSAFLVLIASVHQVAAPDRRIWSQAALAFATAYATLISTVYFVQLTLVAPRLARGEIPGIEPFIFVPFDSFLYAVDILGYSFMSLATLFAARVFVGDGLQRTIRLFLTANGLLLPFIALQMFFHPLIWAAALWAVTFPGSTLALAVFFRRGIATQPV